MNRHCCDPERPLVSCGSSRTEFRKKCPVCGRVFCQRKRLAEAKKMDRVALLEELKKYVEKARMHRKQGNPSWLDEARVTEILDKLNETERRA